MTKQEILGSDEKAIVEFDYNQLDRLLNLVVDNETGSQLDIELINYLIDNINKYGNGTGELLTRTELLQRGLVK